MFYFTKNCELRFCFKFANRQIFLSPSIPEILDIWSGTIFSRKWGSKILGAWHFFDFAPLGGSLPHLTLGDFGPMDPDKNSFCSGAIAPHLGAIWGLAGVHFGPLFLEIGSTDFVILSLIDSTYSLLAILRFKKNLRCVTQINFVQSWKKREKWLFRVSNMRLKPYWATYSDLMQPILS